MKNGRLRSTVAKCLLFVAVLEVVIVSTIHTQSIAYTPEKKIPPSACEQLARKTLKIDSPLTAEKIEDFLKKKKKKTKLRVVRDHKELIRISYGKLFSCEFSDFPECTCQDRYSR